MSQVITGTFRDAAEANEAVDELIASGYDRNDISVIMNNDVREQNFGSGTHLDAHNDDAGARVAKGAAGGSAIGGTIGAIVGAFLLTGAVGATAATGGIRGRSSQARWRRHSRAAAQARRPAASSAQSPRPACRTTGPSGCNTTSRAERSSSPCARKKATSRRCGASCANRAMRRRPRPARTGKPQTHA